MHILLHIHNCNLKYILCIQVYVRRPKGTEAAYDPQYCIDNEHHGDKVNVIGFFTGYGVGAIGIFDDNMDGATMKKMFGEHLTATWKFYFADETWYLLHDNDKKFHSKLVTHPLVHFFYCVRI
jgi:hypothetical protein